MVFMDYPNLRITKNQANGPPSLNLISVKSGRVSKRVCWIDSTSQPSANAARIPTLDGIPESVVIGAGLYIMLVAHPAVETLRFAEVIPYTLVAGLFLSNFPEALSSSANMQIVGLKPRRIFLMWLALMVTTSVGSGLGFLLAGVLSETWLVFAEGVAAGAMLTMIAAAMIPEAAAHGKPSEVGLSTLAGFLAAVMFKLLE